MSCYVGGLVYPWYSGCLYYLSYDTGKLYKDVFELTLSSAVKIMQFPSFDEYLSQKYFAYCLV